MFIHPNDHVFSLLHFPDKFHYRNIPVVGSRWDPSEIILEIQLSGVPHLNLAKIFSDRFLHSYEISKSLSASTSYNQEKDIELGLAVKGRHIRKMQVLIFRLER